MLAGGTIDAKDRPDVYIALVGAAGTDLEIVKTQLKAHFCSYDYQYNEVKVSRLIQSFIGLKTEGTPEDERVRALMDGGDQIRQLHKGGDGVVTLIVSAIIALRPKRDPDQTGLGGANVFVIDSLKNPKEIQTLDKIYGRNFYTVSVYASESDRIAKFANRIAESKHTNTREEHIENAKAAIKEDERRDTTDLSQDVQNTFPKADFFVADDDQIDTQIKRFVDLVFGEPFTTPTVDEYAMFTAKAVSLRSADLSRQVGAAIIGDDGTVISTGFNDVPYPAGGVWHEGRNGPDNRDHVVEFDPNTAEISNIFHELVESFRKAGILSDEASGKELSELVEQLLHGQWRELTIDARVRNLIEFGRVVHAEMHAISEAARVGRAVANSTLYCTTFPCHVCARHIIAAGIRSVVFIEPYPKSLTKTLYCREISTDDQIGTLPSAVQFRPFQGVSPTLYQRVFSMRPRKGKFGAVAKFNRTRAMPVGGVQGVSNFLLEKFYNARLDEIHTLIKTAKKGMVE
ncbi:anti-phage dCTP deaminase [Sphingomonas sp.]|uniref:anti-phage dCTP deaminase n=1 Tax=Sphingomonas sp. TaxID=28214 RepID=UPI0025ED4411|nr:anti-phage dCTP deaminase [Sphingomonas sp.]